MAVRKNDFYGKLADEMQKTPRRDRQSMDLGATIRTLRIQKKLTGVDLCRQAGDLDPKTLNALEKGRIRNPSIATLQSVARGLGVSVADLFIRAEQGVEPFVQTGTQKGFCQMDFPGWGIRVVSFTPLVRDFFCGKLILGPRKSLMPSQMKHARPMYASLLVGRLEVRLEEKTLALREGENLFFHGNLRHTFYNPLEREAVVLLVTAPSLLL